MEGKHLGGRKFWGVDSIWDPEWILTDSQLAIQRKLMEICRTVIRPNAIELDEGRQQFPFESLTAMQAIGLMGLLVPKELGGMGENHTFACAVVETIARYGCPSTAMVYVMHLGAVGELCYRYHDNTTVQAVLKKVATDRKPYLGSLSFSDPSTGGHFWFPFSSRVQSIDDDHFQFLKYGSWATSAGFADWYAFQTLSPDYGGDASNLTCFLVYKDETRANTSDWIAIGMRGNQSGPLIGDAILSKDRIIGKIGEGRIHNDEVIDPFFLLFSSACWMGLSLATIDLAKKHVTRKEHADTGLRVADYSTIQDYFGEALSSVTSARYFVYSVAGRMDHVTNNCNWAKHVNPDFNPRTDILHIMWVVKIQTAKICSEVPEIMLHACGGTGFKAQLGLERLLRDSKAAWVMGPSNEVLTQFVGKHCLFGVETLDFWQQILESGGRTLNSELRKLNDQQKRSLALQLLSETETKSGPERTARPDSSDGKYDFWNPLVPNSSVQPRNVEAKMSARKIIADETEELTFSIVGEVTSGIAGQYVELDASRHTDKTCKRYLSPVSPYGGSEIALAVKLETQGPMSEALRKMDIGSSVSMKIPCGGYEYKPNSLETLIMLCGGIGITPAVQIMRTIAGNSADKTKLLLLYHADKRQDVLYKAEMDELAKSDSRINIHYTVTDPDHTWTHDEGYIDYDMIQKYLPKTGNEERHRAIICGGPSMIVATLYSLKKFGMCSSNIFIYGPFGVEFLKAVYGRSCDLLTDF